jgi:hypothetical protein
MRLHQDWDGIVQVRVSAWEAEVQQHQLRAQLSRRHPLWRRWAGTWLMQLGVRLTRLGAHVAGGEQPQRASATG